MDTASISVYTLYNSCEWFINPWNKDGHDKKNKKNMNKEKKMDPRPLIWAFTKMNSAEFHTVKTKGKKKVMTFPYCLDSGSSFWITITTDLKNMDG